jgi:hypothetical protein
MISNGERSKTIKVPACLDRFSIKIGAVSNDDATVKEGIKFKNKTGLDF